MKRPSAIHLAAKTPKPPIWRRGLLGMLFDNIHDVGIGLATLLTLQVGLWALMPTILSFWQTSLEWLADMLVLDAQIVVTRSFHALMEAPAISLQHIHAGLREYVLQTGCAGFVLIAARYVRRPLQSLMRVSAALQLICLALFALWSDAFAISIEEYTRALSSVTLLMIWLVPTFTAAIYFIVESSHEKRIFATTMTIAYLVASCPIKLAAHALLIQHLSPLAVPPLFVLAGPSLDVLAITALYAWALSWKRHDDNHTHR